MVRRLALALAALLALPGAAPAQTPPPRLDLVLAPEATGGPDSRLRVTMTMEAPKLAAGAPLVRLPLTLVGIPSARYDGDALQARDDAGPLPLTQAEEPPTPQGVYRRWIVGRATQGDVVVRYAAPPRRVSAATNNGPLFDLREERGGFMGAGVGFLATPAASGPWRVRLRWDLARAPAGARGAWSLGQGDVERVVPAEVLSFSYYAVGPLKSVPAAGGDPFALYWIGDPPFDPAALGERIQSLYDTMARFFGDSGASYRVFMRQNPYAGLGGSALAHSFMFGYRPEDRPTIDRLQSLLSHEMAHTWPAMQGEHGDTAWYSEGTAELYSMLLAHRAGLLPADRFLDDLNKKASDYYTNPYRALANAEAARIFWSDPTAQTVPYGRGFLYLLNTDAAIRARSGGRRSLDDAVLALRKRQVAGQSYGIADWLALVGAEIGADVARRDYQAMASGALLRVSSERFKGCYAVVSGTERQFELGFARASLSDDRVVKGLVAGSEAARAGVREGDRILASSDISKVRSDPALPMVLSLQRAGGPVEISYIPRGAAVPADRFVAVPNAAPGACRF